MRIVVAEQMGLVRDGLVALLSGHCPGSTVAAAATLADTLELLAGTQSGTSCVLLLDLALLGADGAPGLRRVRERYPAVRIVALAMAETRDGILECLSAGAHGYVAKCATAAELVRAVWVVQGGGVHVPAGLPLPETRMEPVRPTSHLTGRQRDVLRLMAEGRSTKDIARTLDLAVSTIKVHLAAVYRAMGARNRVEALCRAGLLLSGPLVS